MRNRKDNFPALATNDEVGDLYLYRECLQVMNAALRRDICALGQIGAEPGNLEPGKVPECLDQRLQYACCFWMDHLGRSVSLSKEVEREVVEEVYVFLKTHLLHWLEAMALMLRAEKATETMQDLKCWLIGLDRRGETDMHRRKTEDAEDPLLSFVADAARFVAYAQTGIQAAPLQVYSSALIFAPRDSIIKANFISQMPEWVTLLGIELPCRDNPFTPKGHSDKVNIMKFSPNEQTLASASEDSTIIVWDTGTGLSKYVLDGHCNWVNDLSYSPDGQILASASGDCTVKLWEVTSGKNMQTFECHSDAVQAVLFSPDGQLLASASWDSTIILWDVKSGQVRHTLKGHSEAVRAIAFSPDGRKLASVSNDSIVMLWDNITGDLRGAQTLNASELRFSSDGSYIRTDVGFLEIEATHNSLVAVASFPYDLETQPVLRGSWLYWNTRALLWLPIGFRPVSNTSCSSMVAMGYNDGRVHLLRLEVEKLPIDVTNLI